MDMKICLLSRFFDLRNAGVGRFSQELLKGLRQRNLDVKTVSTERLGKVNYFFYTSIEIPFKIPQGCTVYHSLTPLEALYIPKKKGIVTFHDLIPWLHLDEIETHYTSGPLRPFNRFFSRNYFAMASKIAAGCRTIVCTSTSTRNEIIENLHVPERRIKIIRYGIDNKFKPGIKPDEIFRIGTLSYLDPRKRIDLLIKAFLDADVKGELVIGGRGTDYNRLKELSRNDPRIKFLGFVPDDRLPEFYNSLDAFVFPTKVEGYGLPIVEAFACQKPVIVLKDAFMPEDIKSHCTILVNLSEYMTSLKHNCDIESNYQFSRLHDWDKIVEQYIELYKEME
jgi:glycosyltransferase involved in cell wall biosynthesis